MHPRYGIDSSDNSNHALKVIRRELPFMPTARLNARCDLVGQSVEAHGVMADHKPVPRMQLRQVGNTNV